MEIAKTTFNLIMLTAYTNGLFLFIMFCVRNVLGNKEEYSVPITALTILFQTAFCTLYIVCLLCAVCKAFSA